jgi:type IV pilus assembly protein PilO
MTKIRLWLVLTAVAVVAVLAGGWLLLISPKRAEADDLRAETVATEQQITTLRGRLAELQEKQANLPAQQAALDAISKQIPGEPALPALIRALTNAGRSSGVDLASIAPGAPTALAPVGATAGAAATTPIVVIPLTLTAKGTYTQVQQFVSRLETLQRAVLVRGFQLDAAASGEGAAADAAGGLQLTVDGQVFTSVVTAGSSTTGAGASPPAGTTSGTGAS